MFCPDYHYISSKLDDQVTGCELLNETYCSKLYLLKGKKEYVLKQGKHKSVISDFRNHKCVYDIWTKCKDIGFIIPKPHFLADNNDYYVMEYIKGAMGLQDILPKLGHDSLAVYKRAGSCLRDYHRMMTKNFSGNKIDLQNHVIINKLLNRKGANKLNKSLGCFTDDTKSVLFKDFTFNNVVLDMNHRIYFIDFQKIDFYGPFYYDLARFIDTFKVFTFSRSLFFYISNITLIEKTVKSFLNGYGEGIDEHLLEKMRKVHQQEHAFTKTFLQKPFHGLILKLLYKIMR